MKNRGTIAILLVCMMLILAGCNGRSACFELVKEEEPVSEVIESTDDVRGKRGASGYGLYYKDDKVFGSGHEKAALDRRQRNCKDGT